MASSENGGKARASNRNGGRAPASTRNGGKAPASTRNGGKAQEWGRIPLTLVDEEFGSSDGRLRAEERRLRFAAEELSDALDRLRRAVTALEDTPMAQNSRGVFGALEGLQEETTRELGRLVGERVAAEHRWRVRSGIEVLDRQE